MCVRVVKDFFLFPDTGKCFKVIKSTIKTNLHWESKREREKESEIERNRPSVEAAFAGCWCAKKLLGAFCTDT